MHGHAQKEIRDYADAMYALVSPMVPVAAKAFVDYHHHMGGMRLTSLELAAIARMRECGAVPPIESTNKRERVEAYAKFDAMKLPYTRAIGD